jgi:hypothetical protein
VREWFPELADRRLRQVTWPAIGEHQEFIRGQLQAGVTVTGRLRTVQAFALVLACSRHMFVRLVLTMDQASAVTALCWPGDNLMIHVAVEQWARSRARRQRSSQRPGAVAAPAGREADGPRGRE